MPVTIPGCRVGDALARLQEHESDIEPALSSLGRDWEGPPRIRRYDLLVYLWYQLPTKYLAPLEAKREVAAALAALLDHVGADGYAALCRAPEVEEMLALWEDEDPRARRRLRELLDASGLEPPDTELLTWGPVMGLIEADARDRATEALELAAEAGGRRATRTIVAEVLGEPAAEGTRQRLRRRGLDGDPELADALESILEGDPVHGGGRIDLITGDASIRLSDPRLDAALEERGFVADAAQPGISRSAEGIEVDPLVSETLTGGGVQPLPRSPRGLRTRRHDLAPRRSPECLAPART